MNIAGAGIEVQLGDKKYKMSPINDVQISELDMWIRARVVRTARDACQGLPEEEQRQIMRLAFEYAQSVSWTSDLSSDIRNTIDGIAQILYVSIKPNHPDITVEFVRSKILDPQTLQAAIDQFDIINDNKIEEKKSDPTVGQ